MTAERRIEDQVGGTYGSVEAATGWRRTGVARAQVLAPLTERMLDLAGVGADYRVLDVAAGTGEQTLAAARRVGPSGAVLATDIAAQMLVLAAEAATHAGFRNVATRVLDARDLDLEPESFDAAISRLALMLLPERAQALTGIHRALKPGKKFAALVLGTANECPFIALPLGIAAGRAGTPRAPFKDPGMFALGDPTVLEATYRHAGFREVTIEVVPVERRFPSLAAAMQTCRDALPEISELMVHASETERAAAWLEIEAALRTFENADEIVFPQTYLIAVGTK
jgi:ubiquinone/menaquinone biosynthesis C-methylase UbiE